MKKLLTMLGLSLLNIFSYAQVYYTASQVREILGCKDDETISQCKTRLRNVKLSYEDSVKREIEWKKYEMARNQREDWEKEKERRDKLSPEEREKEDIERRLRLEAEKKKKVDGGMDFNAGALYSNISGTEPDYNPLVGVQLGVHVQVIPLSDDIHLGVGLEYSMQGGKSESHDYVPGGNYSISSVATRLGYLNFPILVRHQRNEHGFFAEAGLQPGLLLNAKKKGDDNVKDNFKKFDVGIPVGIGYKFKNKISVGVKAIPGLMNINKNTGIKKRNFVSALRVSYSL